MRASASRRPIPRRQALAHPLKRGIYEHETGHALGMVMGEDARKEPTIGMTDQDHRAFHSHRLGQSRESIDRGAGILRAIEPRAVAGARAVVTADTVVLGEVVLDPDPRIGHHAHAALEEDRWRILRAAAKDVELDAAHGYDLSGGRERHPVEGRSAALQQDTAGRQE
ncbi:MAG: hypothetical protein RLN72_03195 [Henriciella sp.]